jgi:hypothetical protein
VREYFGEQLQSQRTPAWKEGHRRLYEHYRTLAPQLPNSFTEMEPLFLAVVCGCQAGLYHEALHELYLPRIQRGVSLFAAKVLGAQGGVDFDFGSFFDRGRLRSPAKDDVEEQSLTVEDQLLILMQASMYLTAVRGMGAQEARLCYERAESLCYSLNRPMALRLTITMQMSQRIYSLAQGQNNLTMMVGACSAPEVLLNAPAVTCLCFKALCECIL